MSHRQTLERIRALRPKRFRQRAPQKLATTNGQRGNLQRLTARVGNHVLARLAQDGAFVAPQGVEDQLERQRGDGRPLETSTQEKMESAFGASFEGVRVHTDSTANTMARTLQARAFAHGRDLYFAAGEYTPQSNEGQHVLAHELAHVVQEEPGTKLIVGAANDPAEREADAVADQVVAHLRGQNAGTARRRAQPGEEEALRTIRRQENEGAAADTAETAALATSETEQVAGETEAVPETAISEAMAAAKELFQQAQQAYAEGDYSRALNLFQQVVTMSGLSAKVYSYMTYNIAMCYIRMGDREGAIQALRTYLSRSDLSDAHRAQGEARLRQLVGPESEESVGEQVEEERTATQAPEQEAAETAEPTSTDPVARGRALNQQARAAYAAGNYARALELFQQVVAMSGLSARVYSYMTYNIAMCYIRMGDREGAIQALRTYLSRSDLSDADRAQGEARLRQLVGPESEESVGGRVDGAEEQAPTETAEEETTETAPAEPIARGRALWKQGTEAYVGGDYRQALTLFEQIVAISGLPEKVYSDMTYNIAMCYIRLEDREGAIQALRTYLGLPNLSEADRQGANRRLEELGVTSD